MRDPTLTRGARKEGHQTAAFLSRREERSSGGETHATTDLDELKKHHRFLREDDDDDDDKKEEEETRTRRGRGEEEEAMLSLLNEGERVAKKYEGKLFKEYAIRICPDGTPKASVCDGERRKKSREAKAWIFAARRDVRRGRI